MDNVISVLEKMRNKYFTGSNPYEALTQAIASLNELKELKEKIEVVKLSQITTELVEQNFPKGQCKERGKAIVLHAQMLIVLVHYLQGEKK